MEEPGGAPPMTKELALDRLAATVATLLDVPRVMIAHHDRLATQTDLRRPRS